MNDGRRCKATDAAAAGATASFSFFALLQARVRLTDYSGSQMNFCAGFGAGVLLALATLYAGGPSFTRYLRNSILGQKTRGAVSQRDSAARREIG